MTYSIDFRKRVLSFVQEGHTRTEACDLFGINPSTLYRWERKLETEGHLQDSRKLSHKWFYRPAFRAHLINQAILHKLLSFSDELRQHYELYHFLEKQANHFFDLMEENLSAVHPMFQTVFRTFLKDRDKILNVLIKVIKHKVFGFRNFENFKKRILIALNIRKERTKLVLSQC